MRIINTDATKLTKHKEYAHKDYICSECGYIVVGKKKLYDHRRSHRKISCDVCGKEMQFKNLAIHRKSCSSTTPRRKNLTCGTCGLISQSSKKLQTHLKTHDKVKVAKMHSCGFCKYKSKVGCSFHDL